ncbi:MAG: HAMP domain-containing protein [Deltaproteobacteria bacterium]|nr:MAG: HAMP domain-containing protein [Deltaproteobacteria bacterium]
MTIGMTIKARFLLTITVVALLSCVCMGVYSYQNQSEQLLQRFENLADQENQLLRTILAADAEGLRRAASGLSRLEVFHAPLATEDRAALLTAAQPVFGELKAKHSITHMYFIAPDGTVLLRVHKPEQYGDSLERATFLQAVATKETASGLEMGKNFFSLRCVTPIQADGELLGYLEVAEEIDHVFVRMKEITGHDVALFLPMEYVEKFDTGLEVLDGSDFVALYPSSPQLVMSSDQQRNSLLPLGLKTFVVKAVEHDKKHYVVGAGPIQDAFGETAGVLLSRKNVTQHRDSIWHGVVASLTVFIVILVSGNLLLWLSMKKSMNFFLAVRSHIQKVTRTWDVDQRLEVATTDEIGELAEDLNRMQAEIGKLKNSLVRQTEELVVANQELESFSYTLSHDLRTPLTRAYAAADILVESYGDGLDETGRLLLDNISKGCQGMEDLIEAILVLSNIVRKDLHSESLDFAAMARDIVEELRMAEPKRKVITVIPETLVCTGDQQLLRVVLRNLLENAWKYTRAEAEAKIEFGIDEQQGKSVFYVRDNGIGFNMQHAANLFTTFKRLHDASEYPGTGIGLATVQKIILRHGGTIWGVGKEGEGATFFFTLP